MRDLFLYSDHGSGGQQESDARAFAAKSVPVRSIRRKLACPSRIGRFWLTEQGYSAVEYTLKSFGLDAEKNCGVFLCGSLAQECPSQKKSGDIRGLRCMNNAGSLRNGGNFF